MKSAFALVMGMLVAAQVNAAPAKKSSKSPAKKAAATSAGKQKLSRNLSFSGSAVDGKYHSAGESIANVESEKSLSALMGIRKNFRDRLSSEQARLENAENAKGTKQ